MSSKEPQAAGGLGDLDALLFAATGDDGQPDMNSLFKNVHGELPEGAFDGLTSAEDFEELLRNEWALPKLDITKELVRVDAMRRPDSGIHEDPFAIDDYTDEQWSLVLALKTPCLDATNINISTRKRQTAIQWIFSEGDKGRHGISFNQACRALGARSFVVQALIQHFWFLRAVVLPEGLPFLTRPLSEVLESEAIMVAMEPGLRLAQVVWRFPSIEQSDLFRRCGITDQSTDTDHAEYQQALQWLCENGTLASRLGRVYFTSRHPERRHRPNAMQGKFRGVSWSQSFVGDED